MLPLSSWNIILLKSTYLFNLTVWSDDSHHSCYLSLPGSVIHKSDMQSFVFIQVMDFLKMYKTDFLKI